mgnify:FL=1
MSTTTFFDRLQEQIPRDLMLELGGAVMEVEAELRAQVASQVSLVADVGALTLHAGGKRLRPALVYLSALATGLSVDKSRLVRLGACMEMIHMATLIHDDVIDDAATRRGAPTAFSQYGTTASILGGDVLLAKAMALLAADGDLAIIRSVSSAVVELAEGEVRELELRGQFDLTTDDHMSVLQMKTASFIECCCRVGAMAAGADKEITEALSAFGHHLGMAFQIVDDVLDFQGDSAKTGKPLATDFREGQATLPLLLLLPLLNADERAFTEHKFGNGSTEADLAQIVRWMHDRGSLSEAQAMATSHIKQAERSLCALPDSAAASVMASVARFVIARES